MSALDASTSERMYRYRHTRIIVMCSVLVLFCAWGIWAVSYGRHNRLLPLVIPSLALVAAFVIKSLLQLGETYTITTAGIRRDSLFGTVEQPWANVVEIKRGRRLLDLDSLKIIADTGQSMTVGGDDLTDFDGFCELVAQHALSARGESQWIEAD